MDANMNAVSVNMNVKFECLWHKIAKMKEIIKSHEFRCERVDRREEHTEVMIEKINEDRWNKRKTMWSKSRDYESCEIERVEKCNETEENVTEI